jgi:DNA repair protein RadC
MAHHIFQSESELQNIPEAAPKVSRSFSVSEKLAPIWFFRIIRRGTPRLDCWQKVVALALIRHFGSLKGLSGASFQELRQVLSNRKGEAVVAALSIDRTVS